MLMPVDEVGWASELSLEGVELSIQFSGNLAHRQSAQPRMQVEMGNTRKSPSRRQFGHRSQRPLIGQREVQADGDSTGQMRDRRRRLGPVRHAGHGAGGRNATGFGEFADPSRNTGRYPVVVGADDQRSER